LSPLVRLESEQTAEGLGAKLITGQREDEGVRAMVSTAAPAMHKSAQWYGVRRSENKRLAAGTASATNDLPPAKHCRRLTLLCRLTWADGRKPACLFTGQPQCAAAPRPPGWRERLILTEGLSGLKALARNASPIATPSHS
jgi:hypothetical protein